MQALSTLKEFLTFLTLPFAHLNFIDIAIIVVIVVYIIEGYAIGFIRETADFISFILSFLFGLTFYTVFGSILVNSFHIPKGFGNALGFFLGAFFSQIVLMIIFRYVFLPFILDRAKDFNYSEKLEKFAGIIPGILSALVLLSFILTMIVALPLSPYLKTSVSNSKLGEVLVSNIQGFDKQINNVFGGAVNDALTFLTVEPKSEELIQLNFSSENTKIDPESETAMFDAVNKERESRGIGKLVVSEGLRDVARKHCTDMFVRGYFSHYTPEGKSPFDRMAEGDVKFNFAGENLALAPNTELAMKGLMNSPGHKENILSKNYNKVGVGVIDGGIYGEMFCQEFTD